MNEMSLIDAIACVLEGERVTKKEWDSEEFWVQMLDGQMVLHKPDGIFYPWIITAGDDKGFDWVDLGHA